LVSSSRSEFPRTPDAALRLALGPLADDEGVEAVFRAIMAPPFFDALRGGTRSTEEAGVLITAATVPWLTSRADMLSSGIR
jgi:hypothetical protein